MNAVATDIPLFRRFPRLHDALARLSIGDWPTPVQPAPRIARRLGLAELWIKREDRSHAECGGNKVRGLEFILPDVQRRRASTILTLGAAGSHHVLRTCRHARGLGLRTVAVVVPQPDEPYVGQNIRAAAAAGCRYVHASPLTLAPRLAIEWLRPENWNARRPPYFLSGGGTSPLACIGHLNAALELRQQIDAGQLPEPRCLFVPLGSLGTAAGLLAGCHLAGLATRVVGVTVSYRWYCTPGRVVRLARRTHRLLRRLDPAIPEMNIPRHGLDVVHEALGGGYARRTPDADEMARLFRQDESLDLDPTYTAKAADGMIRYIRQKNLAAAPHLLWYTYQPAPDQ